MQIEIPKRLVKKSLSGMRFPPTPKPPKAKKSGRKKKQSRGGGQPPFSQSLRQIGVGAAMGTVSVSGPPKYKGNPFRRGGFVDVSHRELVGPIVGSVGFATGYYIINPGLPLGQNSLVGSCFTWLPPLASRFEKYEFLSLSFEYETDCSTGTSGSFYMAVDFDQYDASPATNAALMSMEGAVRSPSWNRCQYTCAPHNLCDRGFLYLRGGVAPAVSDFKTYDLGYLSIATSGQPNTNEIGQLYVTYTVRLSNPQLAPVVTAPPPPPPLLVYLGTETTTGSAADMTLGSVALAQNNVPFAHVPNGWTCTLPVGNYRIAMYAFSAFPSAFVPTGAPLVTFLVVTAGTAVFLTNNVSIPFYGNVISGTQAEYLAAFGQVELSTGGSLSIVIDPAWKLAQTNLGLAAPFTLGLAVSQIPSGAPLSPHKKHLTSWM